MRYFAIVLLAIGAVTMTLEPGAAAQEKGKADESKAKTVRFTELLGKKVDELKGCRGEWDAQDPVHGFNFSACFDFAGPADFNHAMTYVIFDDKDRVIQTFFSHTYGSSDEAEARFDSLVAYLDKKCKRLGSDARAVEFKCSEYHQSVSWGLLENNWQIQVAYTKDYERFNRLFQAGEQKKNEGL